METSATYKILATHLVHGKIQPGEEIGLRADQMLIQDGLGTMVFAQLAKFGRPRSQGKFAICYVDHSVMQLTADTAAEQRYLRDSCAGFTVHYSKAGNGIGHQVHLERFGIPGQLLLGADSHVSTLGGLGMLAIATSGLELAVALTGTPHYLVCPTVNRVVLTGALKPWCSAKDVILYIVSLFSTGNCGGIALEFTGPGVATLSVPARATIANMSAELGVVSALFPSDEVTRAYLASQGRTRDYHSLSASLKAEVAKEITVDLSQIVPMAALPHNPCRVAPVAEVAGLPVQQVTVGTCTNGSYEDLARVATILKGNKVHPEVNVIVTPGSRQALQTLVAQGFLVDLLAAGARLQEPSCGFCIGHGHVPGNGWVSISTGSRNYQGRCGNTDAQVCLVSPETAAATALRGVLTDPRKLQIPHKRIKPIRKMALDDSLILSPPRKGSSKVERCPNVIKLPNIKPLPPSVSCEAVLKVGDAVSTEQILPVAHWLSNPSSVQKFSRFVFELADPQFVVRSEENIERELYNLIVAGHNYGHGSSHEYAACGLTYLGARVVLAKSIDRSHATQLINYGIIPLIFIDDRDYDQVRRDDPLEFPWIGDELKKSEMITVRNPDTGHEIKARHGLSRRQIDILLSGGLFNYVAR
jgi:aconitate hydratase